MIMLCMVNESYNRTPYFFVFERDTIKVSSKHYRFYVQWLSHMLNGLI